MRRYSTRKDHLRFFVQNPLPPSRTAAEHIGIAPQRHRIMVPRRYSTIRHRLFTPAPVLLSSFPKDAAGRLLSRVCAYYGRHRRENSLKILVKNTPGRIDYHCPIRKTLDAGGIIIYAATETATRPAGTFLCRLQRICRAARCARTGLRRVQPHRRSRAAGSQHSGNRRTAASLRRRAAHAQIHKRRISTCYCSQFRSSPRSF